MPERSFIILKYVGKVPSLASCAKCNHKFFTPNTYSKDSIGAEEYLRGKFDLHQCQQEDERSTGHIEIVQMHACKRAERLF
jgi:hypothetical protein